MRTCYRSHTIEELIKAKLDTEVIISGWVHRVRDLGGLIFLDLRERSGLIQVVFDPEFPEVLKKAAEIKNEWVIKIKGKLRKRENINENIPTGKIEVLCQDLEVLNTALTPVIGISDDKEAEEVTKLKYRYLDLRKQANLKKFILRDEIISVTRNYFHLKSFIEVETPMLTKSTPEGARDFLVPARCHLGKFYALPQSPQLFKQLLMISGFEKYYQIVKCFRDEDLRADRQPEFTQLDVEASFVEQKDIMDLINNLLLTIYQALDINIDTEIPVLSYKEAMETYGSDKPDLRFDIPIKDITEICRKAEFQVFARIANEKGAIKGLCVPKGDRYFSRKIIQDLEGSLADLGIKGLSWIYIKEDNSIQSPISKYFTDSQLQDIISVMGAGPEDALLFIADTDHHKVLEALGRLRLKAADIVNISKKKAALVWVNNFPLFEKDKSLNKLTSVHHPFTSPHPDDLALLDSNKDLANVRSQAYDIVLNGIEIGGGSIRIHNWSLQEKIFKILDLSDKEIEEKFGFFIRALKYGTPPHGGIALGMDRLVMILCGANSIREVIAFPKTTNAQCPLTEAPTAVNEAQLRELGLELLKK
ncbi:aspartate--tRNA ligase [Candidatus Margulisiibacteriota bacterium]